MQKMKKILHAATICCLLSAFLPGCGKKDSADFKSVSGSASIAVSPVKGYAEPMQETFISGEGFKSGEIPADSIKVDGKKTSHPAVTVSDDGKFPKTKIIIKKELASGKKNIEIAGEKFAGAYTVEPVVLEYMMWGETDELNTVQEYLKKFSEEYPDIKVKILHVAQQYDDKLKTMFAAHTPPDVMYMGLENFPGLAQRGVFLNLQPYITRDKKEINIEDFYPVLMKQFEYEGNYYGIAKDFTTLVLYYNRNLFDEAGIKYPDKNWTWDNFLSACKKLTKDVDGDGRPDRYGFVVETWFQEWAAWIWQNGGELMNPSRTQWLLGSPKYIAQNAEAVQFLADLIYKHKVAPNPTVTSDMGTSDMFLTGKVAMCTYGRWMCMQFRHIKDFKWDVAVMPQKKKRAATLFTVCYSIAKETKHPESAWKLIKFLVSTTGQIPVAESGHAIPARKSIADSKHFHEAKAIPIKINTGAYIDSIAYAYPTPTNPYWSEVQTVMNREMDWVWQGKKSAKEVIETIQPQIQTILDGYYKKK